MASTRKSRVTIEEQIRLMNECRQSGMTDADWCREKISQQAPSITGSVTTGKQR